MKNLNINLNNRSKIILSLLVVLIFCMIIIYFAILNSFNVIRETEDKIIVQKIEQEKKYSDSIKQKQLVTKMKMVESQLKRVDSIFVNKDRMLDFVTTIEGIAANDRVNLKINITESDTQTAGYFRNKLELSAKGNYKNLLNFLEDLETLNYYINVGVLDIQKTPDDIFMNINAEFFSK